MGLEGVVAKRKTSRYGAAVRGWVKVKNPNYWRKDAEGTQLPYLDGVTFRDTTDVETTLTFVRQPELKAMTESEAFREMYDKSDDILAPLEPRVVERPAPRWTFATSPWCARTGAA